MQAKALVDSGAMTMFINQDYVEHNHLVTYKLEKPILVNNADGTPNRARHIKEYVQAYLVLNVHRTTTSCKTSVRCRAKLKECIPYALR